jgi:glycosyltransferase involved in cell wall biosynthesis
MRVCFISHYSELYGANRSLLDTLSILRSFDHDPVVVLPREGSAESAIKAMGVKTKIIPFDVDWYDPNHLKSKIARLRRIKKRNIEKTAATSQIAQLSPDIIHSNSSVFLTGAFAAQKLGLSHIWHLREDMWNHYSRRYDSSNNAKDLFANTDVSIATSNYISELFKGKGYKAKRGIVLPNPIETPSKMRGKRASTVLRFGVVGLLHKRKNQVFVLKSLIPLLDTYDMELHFIGGGGEEIQNEMNRLVYQNQLESRVFFHGFIESAEEIYSHFDVLINFSENEGFGRVNIEAFSRNIPVIGLNSGATPEIVKDQISGLIASKNKEELKGVVSKFLLNPDLVHTLGDNAYAEYQKFYTSESYANKLNALYLSLISK